MSLITRLLLAFALLGTSGLALAGRHGQAGHDRRGQHSRDHRQHRRDVEQRHVDYRRHDSYRDNRHDRGLYSNRHDHGHERHGYGYRPVYPRQQRWVRGHRYHGATYVVRNYGYYRLRPPPRGYHWVRADNEFLLVAITTGLILDLALR